jgi:hypothetical protein
MAVCRQCRRIDFKGLLALAYLAHLPALETAAPFSCLKATSGLPYLKI